MMKRHAENRDATDEPEKKKAKIFPDEKTIELPPELLEAIAAFIYDERSRRRLRLVSKKWFKILNDTTFAISPILSSEISELVSLFSRSKSLLGLHILKTQNRTYEYEDLQHLSELTQLTSFVGHFRNKYRYWDTPNQPKDNFLTSLTNLEALEVNHISSENLLVLTRLRRLKATSFRKTLSNPLEPANLPNLEELNIPLSELNLFEQLHHIKHCTLLSDHDSIRTLPFTALESLHANSSILFNNLPVTLTRLELSHMELSHMDQKGIDNLTNLKHLQTHSDYDFSLAVFPHLEVFKMLKFPKNSYATLQQLSLLPRLRELEIGLSDPANKCLQLIGAMTTLQKIHLMLEEAADPSPLRSLSNLKSLTYDNSLRTTKLDWLKELTQLAELDLRVNVERMPRNSVNLTPLHNLTRLVLNQLGVSSSHYLTNFTKLLNLKLQFRTDEASHLFVGLSTLTTLTSLDVVFRIGDDKWQEITRLTNLQSLSELGYVGNRELRFLDLTAMQKLTSFVTQSPPVAAEAILMNFTALTSLQHINFAVDYKTQNILLERLPYLERPPQKPTYRV